MRTPAFSAPSPSQDGGKMQQFKVTVPSHVKAGQMIRIRCPDGTEGDVQVPPGVKPGETFVLDMPKTKNSFKLFGYNIRIPSWDGFMMALLGVIWLAVAGVLGFVAGVLYITAGHGDATEAAGDAEAPKLRPFLIGENPDQDL